jgi:thioredoxin-like negative regulator of GroEL
MKKLLYFSAGWCQPCRTLGPIMEQVAQDIPVQKINVDLQKESTAQFNIRTIPTVILMENEQEIRRFTGVKSLNEIINFYK